MFLPSDADSVKVVVVGGGGAHFGLFFISFCYKLLIVNFYYFSNVYVYISNKTAVAFFFFSSSYSCYSGNVTFVKIYGKFSSNFSPRLVLGLRVFFSNINIVVPLMFIANAKILCHAVILCHYLSGKFY